MESKREVKNESKDFCLSSIPERIPEGFYIVGSLLEYLGTGGDRLQQIIPPLWNGSDGVCSFLISLKHYYDKENHRKNDRRAKILLNLACGSQLWYLSVINNNALNTFFNTTALSGAGVSFAVGALIEFSLALNDMIRAIKRADSFQYWLEDSLDELAHLNKRIQKSEDLDTMTNGKTVRENKNGLLEKIKLRIRVHCEEINRTPESRRRFANLINSKCHDDDERREILAERLVDKKYDHFKIVPLDPNRYPEATRQQDLLEEARIQAELNQLKHNSILNCLNKGISFLGMTCLASPSLIATGLGYTFGTTVAAASVMTCGWVLVAIAASYLIATNVARLTETETFQKLKTKASGCCSGFFVNASTCHPERSEGSLALCSKMG